MDELVEIVDDEDRVVATTTRARMRAENLVHRSVFILCKRSDGCIYVHRRTQTKDVFPAMHDMFVGGVVTAGESYAQAAAREVAEELGVRGVPLTRLFHHRYEGEHSRAHIEVFEVLWDGPIVHQASEIDWGAFMSVEELRNPHAGLCFVPDGREVFDRYSAWAIATERQDRRD
jgi:8-oxo-dGTP pyrophosphatase MutT (NUDIX family)